MWRPSLTLVAWVAVLAFLHGPQLGCGQDCGGELSQETGTISSRNYPQSYPDNEQCRWTITAADNEVIDLRFSRLDLDGVQYSQSRATCPDYVNVYDGDHVQAPLLAKLCRSKTNEELSNTLLRSTGNTMLVEFISDGEGQRTGFLASYWMHECDEFMYGSDYCTNSCNCDRDNSVSCNNTDGTCNCKPGWTSEDCSVDIDECVDSTVEPCPDYQDCVNTVGSFTCQCKEGLQMNIAGQCQVSSSCGTSCSCSHTCVDLPGQGQVCYCPNNMKLEGSTCVDCDNVSFGEECRLSCSSSCNVDNTQSCNTTGGCSCKDGWTSDDCSEDIDECDLQLDRCQEINKVCVNTIGSYDCVDCNFDRSGPSGIIQSPNYPNEYSNGLDCTWTITAAGDDETVTLEIADLIMYRCGDYVSCTTYQSCYCDTLRIYDGKNASAVSLGEYCSNSVPHLIRSSGNSMHIVYHARSLTSWSERGFNATYVVQDYASYIMTKTDPTGSILIPSSPAGTNLFSVWTIAVAEDKTVAFSMLEMNFGSSTCDEAGLVIYDGALGNKYSGRYCGQSSPFNFTSTENTMSIVFYSDGSSSGQGFEGTYITDVCKCHKSYTASCDNGTCVCREGYTGAECCSNMNECYLELDQCPQYSTCHDTSGSYYCYCNNGTLTTSRDSDACQECKSNVTDESGIIQSPDYPSYGKYYFSCSWTIVGQPGKVVSLRFIDFNTYGSTRCYRGAVEVYDGDSTDSPLIGRYCGINVPELLRTTQQSMHIVYKTTIRSSYKGFQAAYSVHEQCNSNCRDVLKCDRLTGRCEACRSGKTGDDCTIDCPGTTYGSRCVGSCSTDCVNQYCTGDSGVCESCPAGKMGDQCNMDCLQGTYGVNCALQCSSNCKDQRCSPTTGECLACKDGYRGPLCDMLCEPGKYGQGCSKDCSQFCITVNGTGDESPCHHVTGTCIYGCIQGYEGSSCQDIPSTSAGLGVGLGIGLGVAALVIIVVAAIFCYRRNSNGQRSRRERPEGYDSADPTTDEHKYSELFKSADNYNLPTDMVSSSESPASPSENIPQDTVQYVNADVGHYEDIGQVTSNRESKGHFQQGLGKQNESGIDNVCYANL